MEETAKKERVEKDFWDKADIVFRPLNGLLTALAVGLLGYYTSDILRDQDTKQTNERVYTELMSSREQAESGLRKDMFLSIIDTFQKQSEGLETKLLNLELLTYNFHESLNLKPLFAHMNRLITASKDPSKAEYAQRLRQVAKEVVTRQLVLLEQVGKTFRRTIDFEKLKANGGYLELEPKTLKLAAIEREFMLTVYATAPGSGDLSMELGVRSPEDPTGMQLRKFHVGFYDFPMIDNTRLSEDERAAVVMTQSNADTADITLVYFPGSYASLKEKVSYDEVVEKLRRLGEQ